jgi:hypothetical protein
MALVGGGGFVPKLVVAAEQRNRAAQSLKIIATASGGAGIDEQAGVSTSQLVPELQVTYDMLHLRHPAAIGFVVGAPIGQWIHIEILLGVINVSQ